MNTLVYIETGKPVKVNDMVPGRRLGKLYAHVMAIHPDSVELLYNGDCRNYKVGFDVIDAARRTVFAKDFKTNGFSQPIEID
jgi:hypothetical protein